MSVTDRRFKGPDWYNKLWGWHLAYVWAGINTLLGILLEAITPTSKFKYRIGGLRLRQASGWLASIMTKRDVWAFTLGHIIFLNGNEPLENVRTVLAHELVHVHQYEILGPFFFLVYIPAYLSASLRGLVPMRDAMLEAAAYKTQERYKTFYADAIGE